MVLVLDDIEYCSGGGQKKEPAEEAPQPMTSSEPPQEEPSTFTGYVGFGGSEPLLRG